MKSVLPLTPMLIQCLRPGLEYKSLKKHFTQLDEIDFPGDAVEIEFSVMLNLINTTQKLISGIHIQYSGSIDHR